MMNILYLDNIRSFDSTFLNLKYVNFFVGENSTGKSSILKLISILSSPGFWLNGLFSDSADSGFSGFSDIITLGSQKDHFEIGFLKLEESSPFKGLSIRMKFIGRDDVPFLKELVFFDGRYNIQISVEGHFIKYRYQRTDVTLESHSAENWFKSWVSDNNSLQSIPLIKEKFQTKGIIPLMFQVSRSILIGEESLSNSNRIRINMKSDMPIFLDDLTSIGMDIFAPKKSYSPSDQVASSLKLLLDVDSAEVATVFRKFGLDSGMFDGIEAKDLLEIGDKEVLFKIQVHINERSLSIHNVGYGVSQVLPLIALPLYDSKIENKKSWFAIQAPEAHLHPSAQAAYGEFIFKCYERDKQKFIIETHSDYIIDRFRIRINRANKNESSVSTKDISQIIFFKKELAKNVAFHIVIDEDGAYPLMQPAGFRDFFIREQLDLLNI